MKKIPIIVINIYKSNVRSSIIMADIGRDSYNLD